MVDHLDFDLNKDGIVTQDEINRVKEITDVINKNTKANEQKSIVWVALSALILIHVVNLTPLIPESRVVVTENLAIMTSVALGSIVGAYVGVTAWISRK